MSTRHNANPNENNDAGFTRRHGVIRRQLIHRGWTEWPFSTCQQVWHEMDRLFGLGFESSDQSAERHSEILYDIARSSQMLGHLETALRYRLVPLRTRVLAPRQHKAEGTKLQDQSTYSEHFPPGAYAVSVVMPRGPTTITEAAPFPGHGVILEHRRISARVWGAQLTLRGSSGPTSTKPIMLREGEAIIMTSYFCHYVPITSAPTVSFDYRTSPYRQACSPLH